MRRWIAIFFMLFLPFQAAWVAASPYCAHETDASAMHFGHHVHHHDGAGSAHGGGPEGSKSSVPAAWADLDCHACHGVGCAVVAASGGFTTVAAVGRPQQAVEPQRLHPPLSRPERPNWSVLA